MKKLEMWAPLHGLLTSPSAPDSVRRHALWVLGTAVQNNPSAQAAYLALSPLPTLLSFLSPQTPAKTRAKALYALSGAVKHSAPALAQLGAAGGWPALRGALGDSDVGVRRKAAFLLNTLLVPSAPVEPAVDATGNLHSEATRPAAPVHANTHAAMLSDPGSTDTSTPTLAAFHEHGILAALVDALAHPVPHGPDGDAERDADFEENVVQVLATYALACHGAFGADEKAALRAYLAEDNSGARWGLSVAEHRALHTAL
jgi:hsp70-interacting protein